MVKRMSARDARRAFSDLLGTVYYTREPVIIERRGRIVAVAIHPDDYDEVCAWRLTKRVTPSEARSGQESDKPE